MPGANDAGISYSPEPDSPTTFSFLNPIVSNTTRSGAASTTSETHNQPTTANQPGFTAENQSGHQSSTLPVVYYPYPYISSGSPSDKPKRTQVKNACTNCQKACKKCDEQRPCGRCVRYGLTDCTDSERKKRVTGAKRGPYRRRERVVAPPEHATGEAGLSDSATTAAGTGSSTSIDTSQQNHTAVFPFPMFFSPANGTQAVQAGLFAVYGYSTNGIPLGPDGQPIQFGTTYPVPIGYIPATISVPPNPATQSEHETPSSSQAATPQGNGNGEDLNERETCSTVDVSDANEGTHGTNGGNQTPNGEALSHPSQLAVGYSDQDSSFSPSFPITSFGSLSPLASTPSFHASQHNTQHTPTNSPSTRKRKIAEEVSAVIYHDSSREDQPHPRKKGTKADPGSFQLSGDLRMPLSRSVALPPSELP
ncbi:uncharacterized protein EI90DRAFT_3035258 [Cantharellus anzutake]|uniref:uncharacterized protein n=1 Tax=Cantharellus anzutake TaxID=1750568 RepID=UPI001905267C|nr:uncharacterized protein EI90DRAFT_3035258 [Cantharellus anzutake]KAF8340346.1 hypothetical protein EI90DRAFT_3035258 [Cantharellus anzutake]